MLSNLAPKTLSSATPDPPLQPRAQVLARTLLLAQFAAPGMPCFSASTLSGPSAESMRREVALLGSVRRVYAELLNPPRFDSPRQMQWYTADSGE